MSVLRNGNYYYCEVKVSRRAAGDAGENSLCSRVSALIQSPQVLVYAGFNYQGNANAVINLKEQLKNFIAEGAFAVDHFYIFYVQWKAGYFIIF